MNRVRNSWPIIFLMLIFFACGSKMRQTESVDNYSHPEAEQPDTFAMSANVPNNSVNEENSPSSVSSSLLWVYLGWDPFDRMVHPRDGHHWRMQSFHLEQGVTLPLMNMRGFEMEEKNRWCPRKGIQKKRPSSQRIQGILLLYLYRYYKQTTIQHIVII